VGCVLGGGVSSYKGVGGRGRGTGKGGKGGAYATGGSAPPASSLRRVASPTRVSSSLRRATTWRLAIIVSNSLCEVLAMLCYRCNCPRPPRIPSKLTTQVGTKYPLK
jgi:hypothetical protein